MSVFYLVTCLSSWGHSSRLHSLRRNVTYCKLDTAITSDVDISLLAFVDLSVFCYLFSLSFCLSHSPMNTDSSKTRVTTEVRHLLIIPDSLVCLSVPLNPSENLVASLQLELKSSFSSPGSTWNKLCESDMDPQTDTKTVLRHDYEECTDTQSAVWVFRWEGICMWKLPSQCHERTSVSIVNGFSLLTSTVTAFFCDHFSTRC